MGFSAEEGLRLGLMGYHEVTLVVDSSPGNQRTHLEPTGAVRLNKCPLCCSLND